MILCFSHIIIHTGDIQYSSCLAEGAASLQCWSSHHRPLVRIIDGRYYSNDSLCVKEWNHSCTAFPSSRRLLAGGCHHSHPKSAKICISYMVRTFSNCQQVIHYANEMFWINNFSIKLWLTFWIPIEVSNYRSNSWQGKASLLFHLMSPFNIFCLSEMHKEWRHTRGNDSLLSVEWRG